MTTETHQHRQANAHGQASSGRPGRPRLVAGIVTFGVAAGVGGLVLVGLDIDLTNVHLAVYSVACFVLAGLAAGLVCINALLADRQEFYRRGQLDGWMRGWRGQEPDADDPLLRH